MSDPRVEVARSALDDPLTMLGIDPDERPEHGGPSTGEVLARAAIRAADALDPLLPKVRALYEAAQQLLWSEAVRHHDFCLPAACLPQCEAGFTGDALEDFTADDLARLGITEPVTP